jgi:hypothetical protein
VDDDLLALERRIEVRDDADLPRVAEPEGLRRGAVLAAGVERAALELLAGRRLELREPGAGSVAAPRGEDDAPAGERILEYLGQRLLSPRLTSELKSSIGSGKITVEVRSELISSIVCR